MTTHLYCVLPHDTQLDPPAELKGVAGATVRALPVDGLVAWVSDAQRGTPASIEGIRAHNDVVDAAMETGFTPIPARFGQQFDDDNGCRSALTSRASVVEPLLAAMQGFVEMTLIITPSTKRMVSDLEPVLPEMFDTEADGVGRNYLNALRKQELRTGQINHATDGVASALEDAARPFVRRGMAHQAVTALPLRTISHLVARADIDRYDAAVRTVDGGTEFRFLVIGPRAPYSFCALGADAGVTHGMNLAG